MSYTGGTVLAMAGKDCVCIATDLRFGEQMTTIAVDQKKVHRVAEGVYVGLAGFASDAKTVLDKLEFRKSLYELRENRKISPKVYYVSSLSTFPRWWPRCCRTFSTSIASVATSQSRSWRVSIP